MPDGVRWCVTGIMAICHHGIGADDQLLTDRHIDDSTVITDADGDIIRRLMTAKMLGDERKFGHKSVGRFFGLVGVDFGFTHDFGVLIQHGVD